MFCSYSEVGYLFTLPAHAPYYTRPHSLHYMPILQHFPPYISPPLPLPTPLKLERESEDCLTFKVQNFSDLIRIVTPSQLSAH